jgi:hypothetical protein
MVDKPTEFVTTDLAVTKIMKRSFLLYIVHEVELDQLVAGYTSVHFGCAGVSVGILATLLVTRAIVEPLSTYIHLLLSCSILIFVVASAYFIVMAVRDYKEARKAFGRIRTQTQEVLIRDADK